MSPLEDLLLGDLFGRAPGEHLAAFLAAVGPEDDDTIPTRDVDEFVDDNRQFPEPSR
jgi:hypothetical protein